MSELERNPYQRFGSHSACNPLQGIRFEGVQFKGFGSGVSVVGMRISGFSSEVRDQGLRACG